MLLDEKQDPCPVGQVKGGEVPSNLLCDLQSIRDTISLVNSRHKDLSDKKNLHYQEHSPLCQCHHNIKGKRGVDTVIRVVMANWISSHKIAK